VPIYKHRKTNDPNTQGGKTPLLLVRLAGSLLMHSANLTQFTLIPFLSTTIPFAKAKQIQLFV
jgi:hypothetical protein